MVSTVPRAAPPRTVTLVGAALVGLAPAACADDAGPFDRDRLEAISREVGDANGDARSGNYVVSLEGAQCGCRGIDDIDLLLAAQALNAQVAAEIDNEGNALDAEAVESLLCASLLQCVGNGRVVEVVEFDGFMRMTPTARCPAYNWRATGPIDAAGEARAAAISEVSVQGAGVGLGIRLLWDLKFHRTADGDDRFDGTVGAQARIDDGKGKLRCELDSDLTAERSVAP